MNVYRVGYRIYAANPLDGEGSFLFGGRWSSVGTRMAYTSTTLSLAMAEFLAHVNVDDFDPDTAPALSYMTAIIPDESVRTLEQIGVDLPESWSAVPAPASDAVVGDDWLRSGVSLALIVPSVHLPIATPERNILIDPTHRDFERVTWTLDEFTFDRRLVRARVEAERRKTP